MEKLSSLKDRFREFLDYYNLSPDKLEKKIGGSRGTYFAIQNGKSKPDYSTLENILASFPDISAEWLFRGMGPMLKDEILGKDEAEQLKAENKAIKAMYRDELLGKTKAAHKCPGVANAKYPDQGIVKTDKGFRFFLTPVRSLNASYVSIP